MHAGTLIYSRRTALISLALTALLVAALGANPFGALYLLPAVLFLFPFVLIIVLRMAGPLPALIALGMMAGGTGLWVSPGAAIVSFVYLLVPLAAYYGCMHLRVPGQRAMEIVIAAYIATVVILFIIVNRRLGGDPYGALSQQLIDGLNGIAERDSLLNAFYQYGMLALPQELAQNPLVEAAQGGWTFSPQVLHEFYKQISLRVGLWLRALVPSLISSHSLFVGIGGLFMGEHFGRRQSRRADEAALLDIPAEERPGLALPPFSQWVLPKAYVTPLFVMGGLSLVARLLRQPVLAIGGQMLYNVAAACFTLQGLAFVNHLQKAKGTRPGLRGFTLLALGLVLPQAAMILGIFEQLSDARKLRKTQNNQPTDRRDE